MPRQLETRAATQTPPAVEAAEPSRDPRRAPGSAEGFDAQSAALAPAASGTYTVQRGDTLSAIAGRLLGSQGEWRALWEANRATVADPNRISPGQVLRLPGAAAPTPVAAPRTYTVRAGDTLGAIAQRELGSEAQWRALYEANRRVIANPNLIRPGQVLTLPSRGTPAPSGPTPTPNAPTPTPAAPTPVAPGGDRAASADEIQGVAMRITTVLETGGLDRYGAINDYDNGVISYGKHQATLMSGALEALLNRYIGSSSAPAASTLSNYMGRVRQKDKSLRTDQGFKRALVEAAADPAMQKAQDAAIIVSHYKPAAKSANEWGIESPLGVSMLYDTNLQGGMATVLARTKSALGGVVGERGITEHAFLAEFNRQRRARLISLAKNAGLQTRHGKALFNSTYRCDAFDKLLSAGNLQLAGDIDIRGTDVPGIAS